MELTIPDLFKLCVIAVGAYIFWQTLKPRLDEKAAQDRKIKIESAREAKTVMKLRDYSSLPAVRMDLTKVHGKMVTRMHLDLKRWHCLSRPQ